MTTETTTPKKRTITLTGRPPVRITEDAWPVIARAVGDSYGGGDYCRHEQALSQGECDRYAIRVRQHADGRAVVYAVLDAACSAWGAPAHGIDHREGLLLNAGADLAAAIRRVGDEAELPEALIRECIADLPAEELDDAATPDDENLVVGEGQHSHEVPSAVGRVVLMRDGHHEGTEIYRSSEGGFVLVDRMASGTRPARFAERILLVRGGDWEECPPDGCDGDSPDGLAFYVAELGVPASGVCDGEVLWDSADPTH